MIDCAAIEISVPPLRRYPTRRTTSSATSSTTPAVPARTPLPTTPAVPARTPSSTPPVGSSFGDLIYHLPAEEKSLIRRIEKILYKINAAESAVAFNFTCLNEGLLPKYTNLRLHDPTAANNAHTLAFRRRLTERQLNDKEQELRALLQTHKDLLQQWTTTHTHHNRTAIQEALSHLQEADRRKKERTILRKLSNLNGGKIRLPQKRQAYINLTNYVPDHDEEALLQLGLNCHYSSKPSERLKRLEVEVLLDHLTTLEKDRKVELDDSLHPLLLAEALTSRNPQHHRSLLTRELREAAKKLKDMNGITVRRADKTPALVLINTEEYHQKLDAILQDQTKFRKITRNPVEDIKREANSIIERVNALSSSTKFSKIKGDFEPGYIYGNVKTHKPGNPLRPIISQIPTPTYNIAKRLNSLLTPYIPSKYRVKSSTEFLQLIRDTPATGTVASLDVESLFTNVPVAVTIDMICDRVYRDDATPTLQVPEDALRRLLQLCTMSAPFTTHRGELYTQVDGVAMGSPLGVLFADFYMGIIEERVFQLNEEPVIYCRYVDDTFIKASSHEQVEHLRRQFEEHSVLRFTCENSANGKLPFLDVSIQQDTSSNTIKTDVYRKGTNLGLCLNGKSECPERYKSSAINSYIRRAISHCSTWHSTTDEIEKSSQILVNNGFSNKQVHLQTKRVMDRWYLNNSNNTQEVQKNRINLFYRNQFHTNYKEDEKALRNIITEHVKVTDENSKLKLIFYYKNKKTQIV